MATATVTNVVVASTPNPPGFNYGRWSSKALAWTQLAAGIIMVVLIVILMSRHGTSGGAINVIFLSILFTGAGSFGIIANKWKTSCWIVTHMVLSIIASVFAIPNFLGAAVSSGAYSGYGRRYADVADKHYILVVVLLGESIASIWSAAICCNAVCCGRRQTTGAVVGYQVQNGQVVVTMVNPAVVPQQPVSSPPYLGQGAAAVTPYAEQQPFQGASCPPYPGHEVAANVPYPVNQMSHEDPPPKY